MDKVSSTTESKTCTVMTTLPSMEGRGGVSGFLRNLMNHIDRDGITISTLEIGSKPGNPAHPLMDQLRFRSALRRVAPDLVHINPSLKLKSFIRDGLFVWQCTRVGIPVIVFFHGWNKGFEANVKRQWFWFFKLTWGKADRFIVLASDFRRTLRKWEVSKPIDLETTAVNEDLLADFDLETKLNEMEETQELRLLFLARVERAKGIFELLEALAILVQKNKFVRLVIAGDGPDMKEVVWRVKTLGLMNYVQFIGYVQNESKKRAFANAHIYVLLSWSEGMPVSLLEAMSFGLPIITRSVGGLADFFHDGLMGRITESRDPKVIACLIDNLASDRAQVKQIARYNYDYAKTMFYSTRVASRIRKIYRDTSAIHQGRINTAGQEDTNTCLLRRDFQSYILNEICKLDDFFTKNDFNGYSINSLPRNKLLIGTAQMNKTIGVFIRQIFRISPINLRPLLGPKEESWNAQAAVILARAYLRLFRVLGKTAFKQKGLRLLDWLEQTRSPRFTNFCLPQLMPLFVSSYNASSKDISPLLSCYAGKLFLEAHALTGSDRYLSLARSVANYFATEHQRDEYREGVYFHYVPGMRLKIYNCSAEISAFLVQVAAVTDDKSLHDLGVAGLSYVASIQNSEGSWFYGETKSKRYIDNFHTAYILQAMLEALDTCKDENIAHSFSRGLSYYKNALFVPLPKGGIRPRHFDPRFPPRNSNIIQKVDLRDAASAIIFFSSLAERKVCTDNWIASLAIWTTTNMRSCNCYHSELTWLWSNSIPYIDIVSWIFLALSHCLEQ